MRWVKQRDGHSCVPVAVINLYKWVGRSFTYKDLNYFRKILNCTKEGSNIDDYEPYLNLKFKVVKKRHPKISDINKALLLGKAVVLRSKFADGGRHLTLIVKYKPRNVKKSQYHNDYYILNTFRGHDWFMKDELEDYYLTKSKDFPIAWFIEKH